MSDKCKIVANESSDDESEYHEAENHDFTISDADQEADISTLAGNLNVDPEPVCPSSYFFCI
jgi:hypothetical protein